MLASPSALIIGYNSIVNVFGAIQSCAQNQKTAKCSFTGGHCVFAEPEESLPSLSFSLLPSMKGGSPHPGVNLGPQMKPQPHRQKGVLDGSVFGTPFLRHGTEGGVLVPPRGAPGMPWLAEETGQALFLTLFEPINLQP
ncbi:hypothetical protein CCMA1212_002441 [Trichoderma ghanense]|uniref:Uncharacterized protein n=1 Tax=Trichoderma ghanense TaxID=65468 RepID=A0ABY2HDU4_9HYPO